MYYYSSTLRTTTNENCINNFFVVVKRIEEEDNLLWNVGWNKYVYLDELPQYGGNQGYTKYSINYKLYIYKEYHFDE